MQKKPWKIGFSEEVFARFEVRFDVQQIVPQIVPVFVCDRTGLSLGSNLSWLLSLLRMAVIATIFLLSGDFAPQSPLIFGQSNLHFAEVTRAS
jgi:hypothetical protein